MILVYLEARDPVCNFSPPLQHLIVGSFSLIVFEERNGDISLTTLNPNPQLPTSFLTGQLTLGFMSTWTQVGGQDMPAQSLPHTDLQKWDPVMLNSLPDKMGKGGTQSSTGPQEGSGHGQLLHVLATWPQH